MTRNVRVLSAVSLAQDAASELLYPLLPLLLTGPLGAPAAVVGLVEGLAEGAAAVTKYGAGRFSDRVGRKPLVAAGYGLASLGKLIVAAAAVWPLVLLGRVVDRIGKGVRGAPRDALLAAEVPPTALGRAFGFHRAADTLGAVIGPLLGLLALQLVHGNLRAALWFAVPPALLSVLLVALVREHRRPVTKAAAPSTGPLPPAYRKVVTATTLVALVNFPDALLLLRVSELGWSPAGVIGVYVLYNASYALLSYPAGVVTDRLAPGVVYGIGLLCFAAAYVGLGLVHAGPAVVALFIVYGGFTALTDGVGKAWVSTVTPAAARGRGQGLYQGLTGGAVLVAGLWAGLAWQLGPGHGVIPLIVSGVVAALAMPAFPLLAKHR